MWRSILPLVALVTLLPPARGAEPAQEPAAPAGDVVVSTFVPPHIILGTQERPVFPRAAWDGRFTGSVLLEMTVQKDGAVGEVTIVECTRPKLGFEEAALHAVRQWRFEPALEGGAAVEVRTRIRLNFTRTGVGLEAKPQVSAGAFSLAGDRDQGGTPGSVAAGSGAAPKR